MEDYKDHRIAVSKPETLPSGKRKGVIDVTDKNGNLVKIFLYTIGNRLGLNEAKKKARAWLDKNK